MALSTPTCDTDEGNISKDHMEDIQKTHLLDLMSDKERCEHINSTEDSANIQDFAESVRNGSRVGATGKALTDVVAIGGSFLGPSSVHMALQTEAEAIECAKGRQLLFLANVDSNDVERSIVGLNPETTLVVVASKTFTTAETMLIARTMREWISLTLGPSAVAKHMVAVSSNLPLVEKFGIDPNNAFAFCDWVGGHYSVCSAVGVLPLSLQYGFPVVKKFLEKASSNDQHFNSALGKNTQENIPSLTPKPSDWEEQRTADGKRFYRNKVTGKACWELPVEPTIPIEFKGCTDPQNTAESERVAGPLTMQGAGTMNPLLPNTPNTEIGKGEGTLNPPLPLKTEQEPKASKPHSPRKPNILLAATGVMAVKEFEDLCRSFRTWAGVLVVATKEFANCFDKKSIPKGVKFITDETDLSKWSEEVGDGKPIHYRLAELSDVLVIAPTSANTLAKIVAQMSDDLLMSVVRLWDFKRPLYAATAMSPNMWQNQMTKRHINAATKLGVTVLYDKSRKGAMVDPSFIVTTVGKYIESQSHLQH